MSTGVDAHDGKQWTPIGSDRHRHGYHRYLAGIGSIKDFSVFLREVAANSVRVRVVRHLLGNALMPIPKAVARFNRYVTNPIARLIAGWAPMFAILYHQGRRTGRRYSTPVNIFQTDDGFVIALTYGSDVDWIKNILATGEASIRHRSRLIRVVSPELIPTREGMAAMPRLVRLILRLIDVTEFLHLTAEEEPG